MRAEGWVEAEKASIQQRAESMRECRRILRHAPRPGVRDATGHPSFRGGPGRTSPRRSKAAWETGRAGTGSLKWLAANGIALKKCVIPSPGGVAVFHHASASE